MSFTFYSRREYFEQLARDIWQTRKGDRVALATMTFDATVPSIAEIIDALEGATLRGVQVTFLVDAYTFLTSSEKLPGPLWYRPTLSRPLPGKFRYHYEAMQRINQAGGTAIVTNMPRHAFHPVPLGRSHIKAAVINNKIYVGGCNLTSPAYLDMMASWNDDFADWIYEHLQSMAKHTTTKTAFGGHDLRHAVDDKTTLILDSGKPRQSAILEAAYQLIDNAERSIVMTCQYFPGGTTAKHLLAAQRRGVDIKLYYSHPSVHGLEAPAHQLYILRERARIAKELFSGMLPKGKPRLHAKILLSEKEAMIGSHNYVTQGVMLGTAEIALHSTNPTFITELRDKTQQLLIS